jgi:MbtH protein
MTDTHHPAYFVVVNGRQQYSIWPAHRDMPLGWHAVGEPAMREACLDWIEKNWVDIRPAPAGASGDSA